MSKKLKKLIIILIILPLLVAAANTSNFSIRGVRGKLLTNVKTRLNEIAENKPLNTIANEELVDQIAQALYPYGYFKAQVAVTAQGQSVKIRITPGPRMLVDQVSISIIGEGKDNALLQQTIKAFKIHSGKPVNSIKYEQAKQSLLNAAENQGYLHASFEQAELRIDKEQYRAEIILVFNTGPQYYFGQVKFDPTYISPELLHRYIPFRYGQPYSTEEILAFNNALASSGYFKTVIVKPNLDTSETTIPVDVHLQRAHRMDYSLGLGFGTDTGIRGRLGYHVVPVNRAGHKFNAYALGSFKENRLQAQYIIPGKNPVTDQYDIFGSLANLHYDAGYSNSALVSLAERHNLNDFQRVISLNGLYERFNYDNTPKLEKLTLYPKISLTWMNKSDQLFSPSGYNLTLNALTANRAMLSEINFLQGSVDAKAALTLKKLRTRFYFHTVHGFTLIQNVNDLPLSLALLLGGADNLKAYSYNSIGPGKILNYGGLEIQKETFDHWFVTAFADTGDVYRPSMRNWQNDVGIGLMWVSPIGPIKIGLAQPINSHFDHWENGPRLVINMGPDL